MSLCVCLAVCGVCTISSGASAFTSSSLRKQIDRIGCGSDRQTPSKPCTCTIKYSRRLLSSPSSSSPHPLFPPSRHHKYFMFSRQRSLVESASRRMRKFLSGEQDSRVSWGEMRDKSEHVCRENVWSGYICGIIQHRTRK